jgi:hypothetical protein
MGARDATHLRTAIWRESFVIAWRDLPQRVKLPAPGKLTHRSVLLDAGMRLAALAQPNAWLVGEVGEPYTERQLAEGLGMARETARGVLRWFAETGWLLVTPTHSRRAADERELVIPPTAIRAWPGWPLKVVAHWSSSSGRPQGEADVAHSQQVVAHWSSSSGRPPPGNPVTRAMPADAMDRLRRHQEEAAEAKGKQSLLRDVSS